ncbi:MAG: S8 family peptidase [Thermodesulfobacteriota bacterium]
MSTLNKFLRRLAAAIMPVVMLVLCCPPSPARAGERSVIVGFHGKPGAQAESLLRGHGGRVTGKFRHLKAVTATLSDQKMAELRKNPAVKYVVEDTLYQVIEPINAAASPEEYLNSWGVAHIGGEIAHSDGITGAGVRVAVLDSGIDYNHPELAENYQGGWDFVFNDSDPLDDSWNSHGTHVAGIIAAAANGSGCVGVAPNTAIYGVKVLDGAGFGLLSWIIAGIDWAVDNDIDIVNISIGGPHTAALEDACATAYQAGVLLVAAAGNGNTVTYPAAYDSVIAVTATDREDQQGWFAPTGTAIELTAPGVLITSTAADDGYAELSGTSQAAPHVSGVAALLLSAGVADVNNDGVISNVDLRQQLQNSARDLGAAGHDPIYGFGLVDAAAALSPPGHDDPYLVLELTTRRKGDNRATSVTLAEELFQITIRNSSLRGVNMIVLESGSRRSDLSEMVHFKRQETEEVTFMLDAHGTTYDVVFQPIGKPGGTATIIINREND